MFIGKWVRHCLLPVPTINILSEGIGVDNYDNRIYFTLSLIIALITGIAYNKVWYENKKKHK